MSNTFPGWTWDAARSAYYYIDNQEFVYQNGTRVPITQTPANAGSSRRETNQTRPDDRDPRDTVPKKTTKNAILMAGEESDSDEDSLSKNMEEMNITDKKKGDKRRGVRRKDEGKGFFGKRRERERDDRERDDKDRDGRKRDGRQRDARERDDIGREGHDRENYDKDRDNRKRDDRLKHKKRRPDKKRNDKSKDDKSAEERIREVQEIKQKAFITEPKESVTDPALLQRGVSSRGLLTGSYSPQNYLRLHPGYRRHSPGKEFFIQGRVFKALWPEALGDTNSSVTTTKDAKFGEYIATKIRWFVVVKEAEQFCTCLPIVTYKRQGVAKYGVSKWTHAIAFSVPDEPDPQPSERPVMGERTMLPGIRIRPRKKGDKLDKMARIDFARMYTVEHKVKAYYFGDVVERFYLDRLIQQWVQMISLDLRMLSLQPLARSQRRGNGSSDEDDSGGSEDYDNDDGGDDDDDEGSTDNETDDDDDDGEDDYPNAPGYNVVAGSSTYQLSSGSNVTYGNNPTYPPAGYSTSVPHMNYAGGGTSTGYPGSYSGGGSSMGYSAGGMPGNYSASGTSGGTSGNYSGSGTPSGQPPGGHAPGAYPSGQYPHHPSYQGS